MYNILVIIRIFDIFLNEYNILFISLFVEYLLYKYSVYFSILSVDVISINDSYNKGRLIFLYNLYIQKLIYFLLLYLFYLLALKMVLIKNF